MEAEIHAIEEKLPFLTNIHFLNEHKVKFLKIKQDTIRQKHEKR